MPNPITSRPHVGATTTDGMPENPINPPLDRVGGSLADPMAAAVSAGCRAGATSTVLIHRATVDCVDSVPGITVRRAPGGVGAAHPGTLARPSGKSAIRDADRSLRMTDLIHESSGRRPGERLLRR